MGFSREVRQEALVLSARHCCSCHRYKGLNVQVHHIVQEADGGANTPDNAICLCFDCHSFAGHYNPRHPMGTKYSPEELKRARDEWYDIVKNHNIQVPVDATAEIHVRYIVSKSLSLTEDILNGDLSNFPVKDTVLANNEIAQHWRRIWANTGGPFHSYRDGEFKDVHEYQRLYPDSKIVNKENAQYPYYETVRTPGKEELSQRWNNLSRSTKYLLQLGIEPKNFLQCVTFYEHCGGGGYMEKLISRWWWFSFLLVTNTADKAIVMNAMTGSKNDLESSFVGLDELGGSEQEYRLSFPEVSVAPGKSILIPLFICLKPFANSESESTELNSDSFWERHISFSLEEIKEPNSAYHVLGPYKLPEELSYKYEDRLMNTFVHELDLSRLYTVERHLMCGSCPHLFHEMENGKLRYGGELFAKLPGIYNSEHLTTPKGSSKLIIAELEDEYTIIKHLSINGEVVLENYRMDKGDVLQFETNPGDLVELNGAYFTEHDTRQAENLQFRNIMIGEFMNQYTA